MKILITGASGFIGRQLSQALHYAGHEISGIGHGDGFDWETGGLSHWESGSVTLESLVKLGQKPDLIIHCAGGASVGPSIEAPMDDFNRTVSATSAVLEYIRTSSTRSRLIYLSSGAVYGNTDIQPITEDIPANPVSPYGTHKLMAEHLCSLYARQFKVHTTVIRFFSIYGEGLRKQLLWDACQKFSKGEFSFFGTGEEIRDWLHVSDAIRLIECITRKNTISPFTVINGGSGKGIRIRDILNRVMQGLAIDAPLVFSNQHKAGDPGCFIADVTQAHSLGWKSLINIDEGIKLYCQWYKALAQ